ncbi:MAG: diaminopimelate epimerase, partial [Actinomycetota bacterium]
MKITTTYGHGTENDFLLIFDPSDEIALDGQVIRNLCSRERGIGADGVIKMVRRGDEWFMDYRNSDGSLAEMCGNGIRVMARYLVDRGHQGEGIFAILTRAGRKFLKVPQAGDISVNMGQVTQIDGEICASIN